ncbi:MAG: hypothetical protein PF508_08580 [Spirochaeta sp.]|jgi:hypothetical protein|nr:hypothetical protein [Spirochaeta sp.]
MPSQIAHLLCATTSTSSGAPSRGPLAAGAQGPDLFYHNQRRRPTSIQYGTLMHRRGYGSVTGEMVAYAVAQGHAPSHPIGSYIAGFVSHAILDRRLHPYINYRSGWPVPGREETRRYRSMHAFLERLIDVALLKEVRGIAPNTYDFYGTLSTFGTAESIPTEWVAMMYAGLSGAYERARDDARLLERIRNAWMDAAGYYQFTGHVDGEYLEAGLAREEHGTVRPGWLSIIHPPEVPEDLDVLNLQHAEWTHPCSSKRRSTESVIDMFSDACEESSRACAAVFNIWTEMLESGGNCETDRSAAISAIATTVGDHNLSDGRPRKRPCRPRHMDPLPLPELQDRIRDSIRRGDGGLLSSG